VRDERIDFLRFLGLAMIILAHMEPSGFIFQMRNFDVPLMVIVSGLSFRASFKEEPYLSYLWSRVKRLVFPVWIFLSVYFLFIYFTGYPIVMPGLKTMLSSYLLLNGIGYVWIIRVFLLVAIVSPFIYSYSRRQPSNYRYFAAAAIIYLLYELLLVACMPLSKSPVSMMFENTILYLIPFAVIFSIGLRLPDLTRNQLIAMSAVFLFIFLSWMCIHWMASGKLITTQPYKYPPQSYYLSYALFISILAWMASGRITQLLGQVNLLPAILFVGRNSIWIYLWHIPFIQIIKLPVSLRYIAVFSIAVAITFLQTKLVYGYILPIIKNASLKKNIRLALTG